MLCAQLAYEPGHGLMLPASRKTCVLVGFITCFYVCVCVCVCGCMFGGREQW